MPGLLQRGQQRRRLGPGQHPRQLGHRDLQAATAGLLEQLLQLGIRQGHMGPHQHQTRQGSTGCIAAAQASEPGGIQRLGRQRHQAIEQAGGGLKQQSPRPLLRSVGRRIRLGHSPHGGPEGLQLMGQLRIHGHHGVTAESGQTIPQRRRAIRPLIGRLQLPQADALHRRRGDSPPTLLLHPGGQKALTEAKQPIRRERARVHRLAVQQVQPIHGGAAAGQEGRRQQRGVERPQFLGDHLHLQREMAAQGRIATADDQPAIDPARRQSLLQGRAQGTADLAHPIRRRRRIQGTGVGQQKQQRRGMA